MRTLPCLTIRQPWAWLIVNGYKDVENRTWRTSFRGHLLIHAGKTLTHDDYESVREQLDTLFGACAPRLPAMEALELGGIVGEARITGCTDVATSRWFTGPHGFLLADAHPLPFTPYRGMQGFFNVPESEVRRCAASSLA